MQKQMENINKYITENYIKLSSKEVLELFQDRTKNKEVIIKSQLPFLLWIATKFDKTTKVDIDELFSIGLETINKCVNDFKTDSKATFTSYCHIVIKSRYYEAINKSRLIPIPMSYNQTITPVAYTFSHLTKDDENEPYISTTFTNNVDLNYSYLSNEEILIDAIEGSLKNTKHTSLLIQYLGLGLDKKKKQIELAKELGISKQRVGQIISRSIKKLKDDKGFKKHLKELYNIE